MSFRIAEGFVDITAQDRTEAGVRQAQARLNSIKAQAKLDADISGAERSIRVVESQLARLASQRPSPEVDADTAAARAKLDALQQKLDAMRNLRTAIRVQADTSAANAGLMRLSGNGRNAEGSLRRVSAAGAAIGAAAGGAARAAGMVAALAAAAGGAAAALAALPGLLASIGSVGGVLAGAFSGVGDALKGYTADQNAASSAGSSGASSARASGKAIRDAKRGVEDAYRNAARTARDSADAVEDAEQDLDDTVQQVSRNIADAKRNQGRVARDAAQDLEAAAQAVVEAQADERDSQLDLNEARQDGIRLMEDMADKAGDSSRDVVGANIALQEAIQEQNDVNADATATDLERQKAAYQVAQAEDRLTDSRRNASRAQADYAEAAAKGISGLDSVVSAQERAEEAAKRTREAQEEQSRVQIRAFEAQEDAARAVVEAQKDGAKSIEDAQERVTEAVQQAADANADASRQVQDALTALQDAQESANESMGGGGGGAASKFAQAMAKLTPEAQAFVYQLLRMKEMVGELSKTAQRTFLPGLTQMLKDSEGLFPIFNGNIERTGTIMGDTARKMGELFKSDAFKSNLDATLRAAEPITKALGNGMVSLTGKIVEFMAKMAPASAGFADFIDSAVGGLNGFFDKLAPHAESFRRIWVALGRIFEVLLPIIGDIAGQMADHLAPALERVAGWLERNHDKVDDLVYILGTLYAVMKGAKVVANVAGWANQVVGLLDNIGISAFNSEGKVSKLLKKLGKPALKGGAALVGVAAVAAAAPGTSEEPDTGNLGMDTANDMGGALEQLASFDFAGIWAEIGDEFANSNVPAIGQWFSELPGKIGGWLAPLPGIVGGWFSSLPGIVGGWFTGMKDTALQKLEEMKLTATTKAGELVGGVGTWISQLPGRVGGWFSDMFGRVGTWMSNTASTARQKAGEVVSGIGTWISQLPGRVGGWFSDMWGRASTALGNLASTARQKASEAVSGIGSFLGSLPGRAAGWFGSMTQTAIGKAGELVGWLSGLPGRILSSLGNLGGMLINSGRALIDGFLSGIKGAWGRITSFVETGMQNLRNLWPFSPAKDGPFSGRGYVTYSGKALTSDFADSLRAGMPGVIASARSIMDATHAELGGAGVGTAAGLRGAAPAGGGLTQTVNVTVQQTSGSPAETGRFVALALRSV